MGNRASRVLIPALAAALGACDSKPPTWDGEFALRGLFRTEVAARPDHRWAGLYDADGMWSGASLWVTPRGRFLYSDTFSKCVQQPRGAAMRGDVTAEGSRLTFHADRGWGDPEPQWSIHWGLHRYLVADRQLSWFCEQVGLPGGEVFIRQEGRVFVADEPPGPLEPTVPRPVRGARVIAVLDSRVGEHSRLNQLRVQVDGDASPCQKLSFHPPRAGFADAVVTAADGSTAEVTVESTEGRPPPEIGWELIPSP
jgi:hypothetical protein